MAFNRKTWKDTIAEYPNRRVLTDVATQETQTVTVVRSVGTVSQEGDQWNAQNMNDLEGRIGDEFDEINSNLIANEITVPTSSWVSDSTSSDYGYKATISSALYSNNFVPQYVDLIPYDGSAFFSEGENEAKGILNPNIVINASGVTFYASEVPSVALKFRIGGQA